MWRPPLPACAVLSLGILAASSGCGGTPAPGDPYRSAATPTEVEVRNDRWEDLTVYLELEGAQIRLGRVTGKTSRILTVPPQHVHVASGLKLVAAHPDHRAHAVSAEFQIHPGERVAWTIELYSGPSPVIY